MTPDTRDQLRDALANAYDDLPRACEAAERAGIPRNAQPIDQPDMRSWWWATIGIAWRRASLVALVDVAIADPTTAQYSQVFATLRDAAVQLQAPRPGKPTVVISYSHQDEAWKDRLATQLKVLQKAGLLDAWDDRKIGAGQDWRPEIEKAMARAAVAVLLISADYLTSDFILSEEVPRLLQRRAEEGLHVFPVIVRPCPWKRVPWLSPIQARPKDGRPLSSASAAQAEEDLAAIADEVADIIEKAVEEKGRWPPA